MTSSDNVTRLLVEWGNGDQTALAELMPIVYDELYKLAGRYLRRERPDHTIQATALVHEAYLKLVDQQSAHWHNRAHFFAVAAQIMRRILVDYSRTHNAEKRGGGALTLALDEVIGLAQKQNLEMVALDTALNTLALRDEKKSKIVELRFFGGLTLEEIAGVLGVSLTTVKSDWRLARAWLFNELRKGDDHV